MSAMRTQDSPSLQATKGQTKAIIENEDKIIIIRNHYLKDIRTDLLEERTVEETKPNNEIVYVQAKLQGVNTEIMIDTGANVSLIDQTKLNRIQVFSREKIPTRCV